MPFNMEGVLITLLAFAPFLAAEQKLQSFTVDKSEISVSGISSGAAMAVQYHMAHSASLKGLGSIAGEPYHCSEGNLTRAIGPCMSSPSGLDVSHLVSHALTAGHDGKIDSTDNLKHSRVFIWASSSDTVVNSDVSKKMELFYDVFMNPSQIKAVYTNDAAHTFPTEHYGNPCGTFGSPYIGRCNYNGAYELLNFIYGNLQKPTASNNRKGVFMTFNQTEFLPKHSRKRFFMGTIFNVGLKTFETMAAFMGGAMTASAKVAGTMLGAFASGAHQMAEHLRHGSPGMDDVGFVYIPSGCFDIRVACKLHVAFHGCQMQREELGDIFARQAGYNEVGELNNIIILYPQVKADNAANPNGCWDWWGYTGSNYDTKNGLQVKAIENMIDRLTGDKRD